MKIALALALLALPPGLVSPPDSAEKELLSALDRFYTWGDLVEGFTCRVHGRWLDYRTGDPRSGQFFGDLEYRDGAFRFTPVRTLGPTRKPTRIVQDIHALMEPSGLLPNGFPVPDGTIVRRQSLKKGDPAVYEVVPENAGDSGRVTFRIVKDRVTGVSLPGEPGRPSSTFRIKSHWIPGNRYLITQLIGSPEGKKKGARIAYHYHYYAGNYFPRAVTEDRKGERLSLVFYWYEIDLNG